MQLAQKLWLMPFLVLLLNSCGTAPKVTVCVSDPAALGFDCYNELTKTASFIPYGSSDKFVAFDPTDAQTLLNWCGSQQK